MQERVRKRWRLVAPFDFRRKNDVMKFGRVAQNYPFEGPGRFNRIAR
jgi:hypothetical protein